jgi:hypothetical protein
LAECPERLSIRAEQSLTRRGVEEIEARIRPALGVFRIDQFWVNPDAVLKTRRWEEVRPALRNMVIAVQCGEWPSHGSAAPIQDGASLAGNDSIDACSTISGERAFSNLAGFDTPACRLRLRVVKYTTAAALANRPKAIAIFPSFCILTFQNPASTSAVSIRRFMVA